MSNGLCKTYTCNEETVHVNLDWQLVRIDLTLLISYLETDDGKVNRMCCFVIKHKTTTNAVLWDIHWYSMTCADRL